MKMNVLEVSRLRALQICPGVVSQLMLRKLLISSSSRELFDLSFGKRCKYIEHDTWRDILEVRAHSFFFTGHLLLFKFVYRIQKDLVKNF